MVTDRTTPYNLRKRWRMKKIEEPPNNSQHQTKRIPLVLDVQCNHSDNSSQATNKEVSLLQKIINELNCPGCSGQMSPPVFRGNSGRNFCKNCFKKHNTCLQCGRALKIRNYSLERLCFDVTMKCPFAVSGCQFTGSGIEVSAHEEKCDFSVTFCPLNFTTKCEWLGYTSDVEQHCNSYHLAHSTNGNRVRISTNFSSGLCMGMIFSYDIMFRFTLYSCPRSLKVYFSVEPLGHPLTDKKFTYVVTFLKKDEVRIAESFSKVCSNLKENNYFSFPLSVLKEDNRYPRKLTFTLVINMAEKNYLAVTKEELRIGEDSSPQSIENAILAELQCPVCLDYIKPPIMGCTNGHHFCNGCFPRVINCPICRGSKSRFTNGVLEDLYHLVNVPVKNP